MSTTPQGTLAAGKEVCGTGRRDPIVVCAADDAYAMPLAVTVRSILDHLHKDRRLRLFVLTTGMEDASLAKLSESWRSERIDVHWTPLSPRDFASLRVSQWVSLATYFRILLAEVLPSDVGKALYLDCDVLVTSDVAPLWEMDLGDLFCLAAQDLSAPYIDSAISLHNYAKCVDFLASPWPIPNYRRLGLDGRSKYFNAGVMLVNVARWRQEGVTNKLLRCLHDNRRYVTWWDQYALNVVFHKNWGELDVRWNQLASFLSYPTWQRSPFDEMTFHALRDEPFLLHFSSESKPWHFRNRHPRRWDYFDCLDRTAWSGWRPERPARVSLAELRDRVRGWRMQAARKRWLVTGTLWSALRRER